MMGVRESYWDDYGDGRVRRRTSTATDDDGDTAYGVSAGTVWVVRDDLEMVKYNEGSKGL
jgi:hypothetical protein